MSFSRYEIGTYQAGEGQISIRGRLAQDKVDKAIIVCHGRTPSAAASQACLQWTQVDQGGSFHLQYLADRGYGILAIDAGGNLTWGNSASQTAVTNAVNWVKGANGWADPTKKVAILGYSMGGGVGLNWCYRNKTAVAGFIGEAPMTDLDYFNANGYSSEISAAYPTGYAGYSPITFASTFDLPARLYIAADDATIPPSVVQTFYNTLNSTDKSFTTLPNGGHASFWPNIDAYALYQWLEGLSW